LVFSQFHSPECAVGNGGGDPDVQPGHDIRAKLSGETAVPLRNSIRSAIARLRRLLVLGSDALLLAALAGGFLGGLLVRRPFTG
jgi:hypothetical protein